MSKLLSPRDRFNLVRNLANLIDDGDDIKRYINGAGLKFENIGVENKITLFWENVIIEAERQKKVKDLLQVVLLDYDKDELLNKCFKELESGFDDRLQRLAVALSRKQCIVFIGPSLLLIKQDDDSLLPFNIALSRFLAERMDNAGIYFHTEGRDNLTYMAQRYMDMPNAIAGEVDHQASILFKKFQEKKLIYLNAFEQLAKFPLSLIINANPDTLLEQYINKQGAGQYKCVPAHSSIANRMDDPDQKAPAEIGGEDVLLYNIFGSFAEEDSVLYTEADFLLFSTLLLQNNIKLPARVIREFNANNRYYLFLGFDFDQWYFKVLTESLRINKVEERSFTAKTVFNQYNKEFFEFYYKFYFIDGELNEFITRLAECFEKIKNE